jgi:chloramphenicol O-acetyltransferase
MINVEYFQVNNEKYIRIYNTDKCNGELRNICIKCSDGNLVLRDKDNIMYSIENNKDEYINIFDLVNKQDIYINKDNHITNNNYIYIPEDINKYKDIDKDIW